MAELVMTAIGPDRTGLVDELTGVIHDRQANIADSRMVNLHGQFAVILLLEVEEDCVEAMRRDMPGLGQEIGLSISIAPSCPTVSRGGGVPYRLRTYAMDQPGIVHRITHLLHEREINIEELQTNLQPGSVTGTPLFTMHLRMTVPTSVPLPILRRDLELLCDALNCDIDLDPE